MLTPCENNLIVKESKKVPKIRGLHHFQCQEEVTIAKMHPSSVVFTTPKWSNAYVTRRYLSVSEQRFSPFVGPR